MSAVGESDHHGATITERLSRSPAGPLPGGRAAAGRGRSLPARTCAPLSHTPPSYRTPHKTKGKKTKEKEAVKVYEVGYSVIHRASGGQAK